MDTTVRLPFGDSSTDTACYPLATTLTSVVTAVLARHAARLPAQVEPRDYGLTTGVGDDERSVALTMTLADVLAESPSGNQGPFELTMIPMTHRARGVPVLAPAPRPCQNRACDVLVPPPALLCARHAESTIPIRRPAPTPRAQSPPPTNEELQPPGQTSPDRQRPLADRICPITKVPVGAVSAGIKSTFQKIRQISPQRSRSDSTPDDSADRATSPDKRTARDKVTAKLGKLRAAATSPLRQRGGIAAPEPDPEEAVVSGPVLSRPGQPLAKPGPPVPSSAPPLPSSAPPLPSSAPLMTTAPSVPAQRPEPEPEPPSGSMMADPRDSTMAEPRFSTMAEPRSSMMTEAPSVAGSMMVDPRDSTMAEPPSVAGSAITVPATDEAPPLPESRERSISPAPGPILTSKVPILPGGRTVSPNAVCVFPGPSASLAMRSSPPRTTSPGQATKSPSPGFNQSDPPRPVSPSVPSPPRSSSVGRRGGPPSRPAPVSPGRVRVNNDAPGALTDPKERLESLKGAAGRTAGPQAAEVQGQIDELARSVSSLPCESIDQRRFKADAEAQLQRLLAKYEKAKDDDRIDSALIVQQEMEDVRQAILLVTSQSLKVLTSHNGPLKDAEAVEIKRLAAKNDVNQLKRLYKPRIKAAIEFFVEDFARQKRVSNLQEALAAQSTLGILREIDSGRL